MMNNSVATMASRVLAFVSVVVFAGSLALPAYSIGCGGEFPGMFALLLGPIDVLALHVPWLANPLLFFSWHKFRKGAPLPSLLSALLAAAAAATFWIGENKVSIAGGSCSSVYVVLSGYFAWLACIAFQVAASAVSLAVVRSSSGAHHVPIQRT